MEKTEILLKHKSVFVPDICSEMHFRNKSQVTSEMHFRSDVVFFFHKSESMQGNERWNVETLPQIVAFYALFAMMNHLKLGLEMKNGLEMVDVLERVLVME